MGQPGEPAAVLRPHAAVGLARTGDAVVYRRPPEADLAAARDHDERLGRSLPRAGRHRRDPALPLAERRASGADRHRPRRRGRDDRPMARVPRRVLRVPERWPPAPARRGTDKMSSEVLVGLYCTYAKVDADEFGYEAWKARVREGRTFVTGGLILRFTVDGHEAGDVVRVPGGGSVTVEATVEGIFPIGSLELVRNGEVIAARNDPSGGRRLELREEVRIDDDSWLAVRSGGPRYFDGPTHRGPWIAGSSRTRHRCTSHAAKATGRASIPTGRARCSRRSRPGSASTVRAPLPGGSDHAPPWRGRPPGVPRAPVPRGARARARTARRGRVRTALG